MVNIAFYWSSTGKEKNDGQKMCSPENQTQPAADSDSDAKFI